MLQLTERWIIRLLAGILVIGSLVGAAERRFRRVRRQLLNRGDEFRPERPVRPSPLAEAAQAVSDAREGQSGHRLLADGPLALAARLALARAAANAIDLQYYAWHDDLAGRLLARAVLHAAERGVRVRILLDDLHARSTKRLVRLLAAHPQITLRVYNPSVTRRAYFLNWLFSFRRLNRRMHNKALVADGAAAIIGGRNIGDVYFGLAANMNFRDLDVLTVGPVGAGGGGLLRAVLEQRARHAVGGFWSEGAGQGGRDQRHYPPPGPQHPRRSAATQRERRATTQCRRNACRTQNESRCTPVRADLGTSHGAERCAGESCGRESAPAEALGRSQRHQELARYRDWLFYSR